MVRMEMIKGALFCSRYIGMRSANAGFYPQKNKLFGVAYTGIMNKNLVKTYTCDKAYRN